MRTKKLYISPCIHVQGMILEKFIAATGTEVETPDGDGSGSGPSLDTEGGDGDDYGAKDNNSWDWD